MYLTLLKHNDYDDIGGFNDAELECGEFLYITGYLNFKNDCWLVLVNGGEESYTTEWYNNYFPGNIEWYYGSLKLPTGWSKCNDFIWECDNCNDDQDCDIPQVVIDFINGKQ